MNGADTVRRLQAARAREAGEWDPLKIPVCGDRRLARSGQGGFCTHCAQYVSAGPDACLGYLPGVSHACCGHGKVDKAYVIIGGEPDQPLFDIPGAVVLEGQEAVEYFEVAT